MHAIINRKSPGFSLIELITVTAILTVVLSGILAVFLGSMKAVRQGYRHMDAYEMTRGAVQVVQRDLTGGFTSRDNGDYYQFYGTPYGMTFVGVASNFQGIGSNDDDNLCRVTYVIRQLGPEIDPLTHRPKVDPNTGAVVPDPLDTIQANDGVQPVFCLIRYVERGIDNLGGFPVDWSGNDYMGFNPTEFPDLAAQAAQLQFEHAQAVTRAATLPREEGERYLSSVERDLWLRMLRGSGPVYLDENGTVDTGFLPALLPDFFQVMPQLAQTNPTKYPPDKYLNLMARDYIVATNIKFGIPVGMPNEVAEIDESFPFNIKAFSYGFPVAASSVENPANLAYSQPITNPLDVYHYGSSVVTFKPFWGSMIWDSNYNPNVPYFDFDTPSASTFGGEGSPLLPRIPAAVHMRIRLKFPAPNVAAAEIQRVLDQTIDVPSAFTRTQLGLN